MSTVPTTSNVPDVDTDWLSPQVKLEALKQEQRVLSEGIPTWQKYNPSGEYTRSRVKAEDNIAALTKGVEAYTGPRPGTAVSGQRSG